MRNRRFVLGIVAAAVFALPGGIAAAGGKAGFGCAPGFDLGALTLEEALELPRTQAGLSDGVFTKEGLAAGFAFFDKNGNGELCFKDLGALNGGVDGWDYFYNVVDDNSSKS